MAVATILAIALAVAVAAAAGFAWRWRQAARDSALWSSARRRLETLADSVPGAWYAWFHEDGTEGPSDDLAGLLGLDAAPRRFADVAPALRDEDYGRLEEAIGALRATGEGFSIAARGRDGGRFTFEGTAATGASGTARAHVVRVRAEAMPTAPALAAGVAAAGGPLQEILDSLPDPVWRRNEALDIVWWNRAFAEALGEDLDSPGADGLEFASRLFAPKARDLAERARALGAVQREQRRLVIDSDRRCFEIAEIPAASGQIGVARDVTELETARDDLNRHVGAYSDVLEKLNTGVAIWGPDRRLKFFNRAYAKLFRLDEDWLATEPDHEELIEQLRQNRSIPEQADFQAYKKHFLDMYTALVEPVEELVYLPDGTTLRVGRSPHPLGGLLFFYEDMSDQLELERARNTLIAVQRTTLDNLSQGVAVYGGDGKLELFNRAYSDLWGLDEGFLASSPHISEVLNRIVPQVWGAGTEHEPVESIVLRTLERVSHRERIERADGLVVERTTVPLPDGATLVTHLDVTDSMRIERALRDRTEALEEADRLKSQFIANVSYELRTPLNTIGGFSEILIDQFFGELNPRQLEYVEGILESSGHLLALINDILDLANIEAGRMRLETESFDIHDMIASVVRLVEKRIFERKLQLHVDVPPDIGALHADERRVRQIIFNLLGNALRYTDPGGVIRVGAARGEDEISIWVADNGRGLGQAERAEVFERFARAGRSSGEPGSGLGLALVKSFVDLHGGQVELESAPGKGTRVTCLFPAGRTGARTAA